MEIGAAGYLKMWAARVRALFGRERLERDLDDEVRFHLEMQTESNRKAGMDPAEARQAARRSFGAVAAMKEEFRERRGIAMLESTIADVRYAVRTLRKAPSYSVAAICVLALAIGANAAMFSVLNATLFRPLPYPSPERLAMVWRQNRSQNVSEGRLSYWEVEQWGGQTRSFEDLAVFDPVTATLQGSAGAERIGAVRVSPNYFSVLGVQPVRGRVFSEEEADQRQRVALISYTFWQTRFGGAESAVGAPLEIGGELSRIIGVLPATFPSDASVWEPHSLFADWDERRVEGGARSWMVYARLRPDIALEEAQAEAQAIAGRLAGPAAEQETFAVVPLNLQVTGADTRSTLWMLAAAVLCVLLIAAANAAGLALARGTHRQRELAIRAAIGASRWRIARQLLAESLLLGAASGLLGLAIAWAGIRYIRAAGPQTVARLNEATLDPVVFACALALCVGLGLAMGMLPAILLTRKEAQPDSFRSGRGAAASLRRGLVVAEIALAMILLTGAGLLIRSVWSVQQVDLGFRPERVLTLQVAVSPSTAPAQRADFYAQALARIKNVPGVEQAGLIGDIFIGATTAQTVTVEGAGPASTQRIAFRRDEVSDAFFLTVGTRLLTGRAFASSDGPTAPRVAIVNRAMAQRLWPGDQATGKRFKFGPANSGAPWMTVVGVVDDMRRQGLENDPEPHMFEPVAQNPSGLATLLVRTSAEDPLSMLAAVRSAVAAVDPRTVLYGANTLELRLGAFLAPRRFLASLLIAFAAISLGMAAAAIYALIQYSVAARTREIGVRMAVGAAPGMILRMVFGEGLKLTLLGLTLGVTGAVLAGRAAASLLYGVSGSDPLTLASMAALLIASGAAACYFPARRAMKVDPMTALRQE